jgi:hypothetical protein
MKRPTRRTAAATSRCRPLVVAAALLIAGAGLTARPADAQPAGAFAPREETPEQFPAGRGRDEAFYACTACHNFRLVAAQGLSRRQWDESLNWMTERHGMPPLAGQNRETILDYLEAAFRPGAAGRGGGWRNPFADR